MAEFIEIQWRSDRYEEEVALRDRLLRSPLGLVFDQDDLAAEKDHLHFGLLENDILIACLVITPMSPSHGKIRQMCVDEARQRSGLGAMLVSAVERELVERGFKSVELAARDIATGFYERLGYTVEGEPFIEVTIPHYKMIKRL